MPPETTVSAAEGELPLHDLGVLFVHGIGEQKRGATLVACGEPLHRWFRQWFEGIARSWLAAGLDDAQKTDWIDRQLKAWLASGEGDQLARRMDALRALSGNARDGDGEAIAMPLEDVANDVANGVLVASVTLRDAQIRTGADRAPSHAPMALMAIETSGAVHTSDWLLAESWWAETFSKPDFKQLAVWLVTIIPWTLGSHFGSRVRRGVRTFRASKGVLARVGAVLGIVHNMALLLLSLPLAVVLEGVVAAVVFLALLPIPHLQSLLLALERVLAKTVGDSLVLVASPLQRAAMIAQVQHDAKWLAKRCKTVVVVAHSQGGAIAHRAMRNERPPQVRLLLTLGSGLRKLEEIEQIANTDEAFFGRGYLTLLSVGLMGYSAASAMVFHDGWAPWWGGVGLFLFAFMVVTYLVRFPVFDIGWFAVQFEQQGLMWADYYATSDPVPNGALQDYDGDLKLPRSYRITNEQSFFADHTTYWQNMEQFVGNVADWLTCYVPGPWTRIVRPSRNVFTEACVRRIWRVRALAMGRWVASASMATLLWATRSEWCEVLAWSWQRATTGLGAIFSELASTSTVPEPSKGVWIVTLGAVVALYAMTRVTRVVWDRWNMLEPRLYFNRQPTPVATTPPLTLMAIYRVRNALSERWTVIWAFFACVVAEWIVVIAFVPALDVGRLLRWGWWITGNILSGVSGVIAMVFIIAVNGALQRAVARNAAPERSPT